MADPVKMANGEIDWLTWQCGDYKISEILFLLISDFSVLRGRGAQGWDLKRRGGEKSVAGGNLNKSGEKRKFFPPPPPPTDSRY